jgi:hypothetical protein
MRNDSDESRAAAGLSLVPSAHRIRRRESHIDADQRPRESSALLYGLGSRVDALVGLALWRDLRNWMRANSIQKLCEAMLREI